MGRPTPNIDGFRNAQDALRQMFGEEVVFYVPLTPTWPADAAIDPETQRPYDPTIQPATSGQASAAVQAIVMDEASMQPEGQERVTAVGDMGEADLVIDVHVDDYPAASGADRALVRGDRFAVTRWRPDGISGTDRWLAFLEEMR